MTLIAPSRLLQWALVIDAVVSAASGVLQLAAPATWAPLLGLPAALLTGSGVFMLAYAATLALMARSATLPRLSVRVIVLGNLGWAAGCVVLAALWPGLTPLGHGYLALQAVAVTLFALMQRAGLRRATPVAALQA